MNPAPELDAEYQRVNVDGTRIVVDAAIRAGVARIVFFSTIAVYGESDGVVIDETAPVRPLTSYARTKAEAEPIVLDARNGEGKPIGVVVRLAAVYGPRVKGNYLSLVRAIARHRFWPIGPGSNRRSLIFEDDAGRVAVHLARHPLAPGGVFNATDGELHTVAEIIAAVYMAVGRRKPHIHVPLPLARAMLGAIEMAFRTLGRRAPAGRFTLAKYTEEIAVASDRLAVLGFSPMWTMEEGWRETVRRLRARGGIC